MILLAESEGLDQTVRMQPSLEICLTVWFQALGANDFCWE